MATTSDEPDDEKQHDRADGGVDNSTDSSHTELDTKARHQPIADEGADNSDHHVTDETKAGSLDNLTGQPPRSKTDQQYDKEIFARKVHATSL